MYKTKEKPLKNLLKGIYGTKKGTEINSFTSEHEHID
jgi:hypothetical protein